MDLTIKPLTGDLLPAYLDFFDHLRFEEHPGWDACYCFSFHFTGKKEDWIKERNRKAVTEYVGAGLMKGYLAFIGSTPVGWCNVNDRSAYQALSKYYDFDNDTSEKVASLVCFMVHPDFRRKGIAREMLKRICNDYSKDGYSCIEVYPGNGELSSEDLYTGPVSLYMETGFVPVKTHNAYTIMRKYLTDLQTRE